MRILESEARILLQTDKEDRAKIRVSLRRGGDGEWLLGEYRGSMKADHKNNNNERDGACTI